MNGYYKMIREKGETMDSVNILDSTIQMVSVNKRKASHLVICSRDHIRYLISMSEGRKQLRRSLASYSIKLSLLIRFMNLIPESLLRRLQLGYYVKAVLKEDLRNPMEDITEQRYGTRDCRWNVIVGTYDEKQKLVFQCFTEGKPPVYLKVGLKNTDKELRAEMDFLEESPKFSDFEVPKVLGSRRLGEGNRFNILITEEFTGDKVKPEATKEIWRIFEEIACHKRDPVEWADVTQDCFSHGDFTPWNMRRKGNRYVVFDWEHCGQRFYGFDFIHYIYQTETLINGRSPEEAVQTAVSEFVRYAGNRIEKEALIRRYFTERERCFENNQ